ncbi:MAG TPA: DUF262 domain-containing protein [Nitrospira sp.]|nr:DUF262 domain-containing protein [Nitrospira sp.]
MKTIMSTIQIVGKEYYCKDIFSNLFTFTIPHYQRPYAWTTEEAGALLDDLWTAFRHDERAIIDKDPCFLGSIVLVKEEHDPTARVIDGQQRLTTLTIMLSVLRDLLPTRAGDISDYIRQKGKPLEGLRDRFRLELRKQDADFFRNNIQVENGIKALEKKHAPDLPNDAQRHICTNALYLLKRLREGPKPSELPNYVSIRDKVLEDFTSFVVTKTMMVVVSTVDDKSAYRIFSVLNSRGLDLSHADILKAEIIGEIDGEGTQQQYAHKWETIEENLGLEDFKSLFAYIRMIHMKKKLERTILEEIRDYVDPKKAPVEFIDNELEPYGEALRTLNYCNYKSVAGAEKVNQNLKWLKQVDNTDWVPAAIVALSKKANDPEWLNLFFQALERLAAGLLIMRAGVNERLERYGKLLAELQKEGDVLAPGSTLHLTQDDRNKVLKGLDGNLYEMTKVRRYVLLRLDQSLSGGGAEYVYPIVTIEHVLPQTPMEQSQWMKWFPDEKERSGWVHRLGNLVLLSRAKNSEAGRLEFEEKKNKYFRSEGTSPFHLTTQVITESQWTPAILQKRQERLIGKLKEIWSL